MDLKTELDLLSGALSAVEAIAGTGHAAGLGLVMLEALKRLASVVAAVAAALPDQPTADVVQSDHG